MSASESRADGPGEVGHPAGLCGACRHVRVVESRRGSRFYLCGRSRNDARYPRYPRIPVLRCPGFERRGETLGAAPDGDRSKGESGMRRESDPEEER